MKKIVILIFVFLLTACSNSNIETFNKEKTFLGNINDENGDMVLLLNTETYITTVSKEKKEKIISDAKDFISKYHKLLDSHHHYKDESNNSINNILTLNENIDNGPIIVDPIVIDALKEAINLTYLTKGYFNLTIGNLSNLYHDKFLPYDSNNKDPKKEEIEDAINGIINYDELNNYIIIDETNNTVELKSKNDYRYTIDLGAFSKGYILDKLKKHLIDSYDTSFLVTAGSSSIVSYINEKEDVTWNVGIEDPNAKNSSLFVFNLNDGAVSTSGDYENYYLLDDGTRRHHIINPFTGYSENYYRSCSIVSNNAYVIDALSTALFNIDDIDLRKEIVNDLQDFYNIEIDYCMIKDNYEILMKQSLKDKLIIEYSSNIIDKLIIE